MFSYDFEIIYKPKGENKAVDALSQNPKFWEELQALSTMRLIKTNDIQQEVQRNEKLQNIIREVQRNLFFP